MSALTLHFDLNLYFFGCKWHVGKTNVRFKILELSSIGQRWKITSFHKYRMLTAYIIKYYIVHIYFPIPTLDLKVYLFWKPCGNQNHPIVFFFNLLRSLVDDTQLGDESQQSSIHHFLSKLLLKYIIPHLCCIQLCVEPCPNHGHDVVDGPCSGLIC